MENPLHIVLFFTVGVSLQKWDEVGVFDREVALYKRLQERGHRVSFVTYGNKLDLDYQDRLPGIDILCNRWKLRPGIYRRLIPMLHWQTLRKCDLMKSNQTNGAHVALEAATIWRKAFIARCGYMWSEFAANAHGEASDEAQYALELEHRVFSNATQVIVTTKDMMASIVGRSRSIGEKVHVIPNYVNSDVFVPQESETEIDVLFVGRIERQKNVESLLEAVAETDIKVRLIGQGDLKSDLERRYSGLLNIGWTDKVPNYQLPSMLSRCKLYVLPSFYEGHPKTLIEAMACGAAILGANSPGINNLIVHGETGWLVETDADSIREGLQYLLNNEELRAYLGQNAREYAVQHFSLNTIVEQEISVYRAALTNTS